MYGTPVAPPTGFCGFQAITMHLSTNYYTLIGSLPTLPRSFDAADRMPISRLKLNERLKMLAPRDAKVTDEMADFLVWERHPLERTDEEIVRHYEKFMSEVDNRLARELIRYFMSIRTVMAGLRCRRLQLEPPTGIPPLAGQIAKNWSHPDFRLGSEFPWIAEVDRLLRSESPFDLERMRVEVTWKYLNRLAQDHFFSFEAVLLYLVRWELLHRWTQRDTDLGQQKFEQLVDSAMGDFAHMF